MLNKMFYSVRMIVILSLSLIGTCYHAYAYVTEVPYGGSKPFVLLPGYTYTAHVVGVGIKNSITEIYWGEWEHKNDCRVRSVHGINSDKQILYSKQISSVPVKYDGENRVIQFQFLKTDPSRQPKGVFCKIEIIAYDKNGNKIADTTMCSLMQKSICDNTVLELEGPEAPLKRYDNNEEAQLVADKEIAIQSEAEEIHNKLQESTIVYTGNSEKTKFISAPKESKDNKDSHEDKKHKSCC